jgi:hypothetical protein
MFCLIGLGLLTVAPIPHDGRLLLVIAIPLSGWLIMTVLRDTPRLALSIWVALVVGLVIVGRIIYY